MNRPLLPIAVGFAGGIILAICAAVPVWLGAAPLFAAIALLWTKRAPAILICALALLGSSIGLFRMDGVNAGASTQPPSNKLYDIEGRIASQPIVGQYSVSFFLDVDTIDDGNSKSRSSDRWAVHATGAAAEGAKSVEPGDIVKVSGLMTGLSSTGSSAAWQKRLIDQGIDAEMRVRRPNGVAVLSQSSGNLFERVAARAREKSLSALKASMPPSDASVIAAIFIGDKEKLDPAVNSAFQATGTVHLLATAGLHIGILLLIFKFIAERLTVPRKWMALTGMGVVWLYALMAGGRPAVTRAAFVASIYFAAIALERIPDLLSALSLCAIVLLWDNPREILDVGFQFTFLTVLGITALMPALIDIWKPTFARFGNQKRARAIKHVCEIESLSLAAQASSAPLVAVYFNLVTIYGLAANLVAVPLMFILVPLTLIVILAGSVWSAAGAFVGRFLLTPILHAVLAIIGGIASLPHCAVSVASPSWPVVGIYYLILYGGSFVIHVLTIQARSVDPRGGSATAVEPAGVGAERTLA